jgi:hypothetical protein
VVETPQRLRRLQVITVRTLRAMRGGLDLSRGAWSAAVDQLAEVVRARQEGATG